MTTKIIV